MKRAIHYVVISICVFVTSSCASVVNGFVSLYGNDNYNPHVTPGGGSTYNPYANFWNNASTSTTSVPAALDPNTAADAAYKQVMNNVTSDFWENAAKEEQQKKQVIDAVAKDVWEHPENYQTVPVQSGSGVSTSTNGTVSGSNNTSGTAGHQCNLCGGTGRKIRLIHPADATQTKWCSECNKSVGTGHFHTRCDLCGGSGWIK